jgi:hypothetical protein
MVTETTIFELIQERQQVLKDRMAGLEVAAETDGGLIPEHELDRINDESQFLLRLAHARLAELQVRAEARSVG